MAERRVDKLNKEGNAIFRYKDMSDKFSNRDYENTFADQAAKRQGLSSVDDYPILNDIEFQADVEKTIKNNYLAQVGLRSLMSKTGGNLSKLLQNYTATDTPNDLNAPVEFLKDDVKGFVLQTGSASESVEGPYDFSTRFVDNSTSDDFLLNPKIRIKFSELADKDSAVQMQWKKTKENSNSIAIDKDGNNRLDTNGNPITNLTYMKSLIPRGKHNTVMSQANTIAHELMHFAVLELYNTNKLDKKIINSFRKNDSEIEHNVIDKMTRRDLGDDPIYSGILKPQDPKKNVSENTKMIDLISKQWLKDNSPSVREYDSSGVLKAKEPEFKEETYEGAIPAGLAKGGDIMPMEQQMEMFALGGLDDDGMSRDPISGNEIPPGSMANEVRDDVEARLSDGEYVVPANVVRFFGVKFFEDLRTQAMEGLGNMEANGRIGGEPVPSALPMQDQMAEIQPDVSEEEMQMLQGLMNEGGYIQGYVEGGDVENPAPFNPNPFLTVGGSYLSPLNPNVTPDPNLPPTTMPVDTPTASNISFVTMINPATGETQVVQFRDGSPVDPNRYNQLLQLGFFVQGSSELEAYKQKQQADNADSDEQMGGDKLKTVEDLIKGDLYKDLNLGLLPSLLSSGISKAFPTVSNQNTIDYILSNQGAFPPAGSGIRATNKNQPQKNGFKIHTSGPLSGTIMRNELSTGKRNLATEAVQYLTSYEKIKNDNTIKGVLNHKNYRTSLIKAGLLEKKGLTTIPVEHLEWFRTTTDPAVVKIVTDDLEATEEKFKVVGGKYGPKDADFDRFGVTGSGGIDGDSGGKFLGEFGGAGLDKIGGETLSPVKGAAEAEAAAEKAIADKIAKDTKTLSDAGVDSSDNYSAPDTTGGGYNSQQSAENAAAAGINDGNDNSGGSSSGSNSSSSSGSSYGGGPMNKGGLIKKPTKKKNKNKKAIKKY